VAGLVIVQARPYLAAELSDALAAQGIEAIRADDGLDALRLIATCDPEVVVLELTLPPLDGWCVLAALANDGAVRRPEIVVRVSDHRHSERALRLGADVWAADDGQIVAATGRLVAAIAA